MSSLDKFSGENLKNIIKQNINKLKAQKTVLEISLKIKETAEIAEDNLFSENQGKDIVDDITDLTEKRGEIVEEIKNINAAIRHYRLKLPNQYAQALDDAEKKAKLKQSYPKDINCPAWVINLYKLMLEQQIVLEKIKNADEINNKLLKKLIEAVSERNNIIKNNRILMDKFDQSGDMPAGSIFRSKK